MSAVRSIPVSIPPDPSSRHLHDMLEGIEDVLFAVEEDGRKVHDPQKPWTCEMLEEIARIVQDYRATLGLAPLPANASSPASRALDELSHFLNGETFIVLVCDHLSDDPAPFAAWAYSGPLDFDAAAPEVFGTGHDLPSALAALAFHLKQ
jgi:hypothetical protein